jgi:dihydroflavonol-4-reductase
MRSVRTLEQSSRVEVVTVCVTGATGFIGAHVASLAAVADGPPRVTYRDEARLARLGGLEVEAIKADVLDRAALRRAFRGCDTVFHAAGFVGSRPAERVWQLNALAPRIAVEAAAAEDVQRVVVTSSVAGIGPAPPDRPGTEDDVYRGQGLGLTYPDAKHEGEAEALAAAARLGVEVVIVNPSYVFGAPVDRSQPGETSTRMIGSYLRGRLPAVVDAQTNVVDVRDVAKGHVLAAERGRPGERYVLGGHDARWVELLERVAELSGVHHPLVVLPPGTAAVARAAEAAGMARIVSAEGIALMAQNWRYSSAKARRELGYRARSLDRTLRDTIGWYRDLLDSGALAGGPPSPESLAAAGLRIAGRTGLLGGLQVAERYLGRRLVART